MVKKILAYDLPRITIRLDVFVKNGKFFYYSNDEPKMFAVDCSPAISINFYFCHGVDF